MQGYAWPKLSASGAEGAGLGLVEERLGRDPWYVSPHDTGSLILLWSVVFKLKSFAYDLDIFHFMSIP